jgi:hypothetical protein
LSLLECFQAIRGLREKNLHFVHVISAKLDILSGPDWGGEILEDKVQKHFFWIIYLFKRIAVLTNLLLRESASSGAWNIN